jgi:hypothetical protein
MPVVVLPTGDKLSATKVAVLAELATWPKGTGSVSRVLDGGTLAALVQFGLAERAPADRISHRFIISDQGRALLDRLGTLS